MKKGTRSWDPSWEKVFSSRDWGKYPPEDLIRFTARNFYRAPLRKMIRFLDAGSGTGACSWYLAREGFSVYGVDGSPTAIRKCIQRFREEKLEGFFLQCDLVELPFQSETFDAVVDVCSLSQNVYGQIKRIVREIRRVLKPGGKFFSMLFKDGCWGENTGTEIERGTFNEIPEGPFKDLGVTHFTRENEIPEIFRGFSVVSYEILTHSYESRTRAIEYWIITAEL